MQPEVQDSVPHVESPYAGKRLTFGQNFAISAFWFGSNAMWGSLLLVVNAKELEAISPTAKAQAVGTLGLVALLALFVPLIFGAISDRCAHKWGRRRPYMAVGGVINLLGLAAMWYAGDQKSYGMFLIAYCIVQLGNNIATAPYNGLIPDLVPENQRGVASGYMGVMSQAGTLLGAFVTGIWMDKGMVWQTYLFLGAILTLFMMFTLVGIKETPLKETPPPIDWGKYVRSLWIDPKKYPDFAWVWITRFLVMMGFYSIQPFAQYYLKDVIGVEKPATTAAFFFGIVLMAAMISGYFGGAISDRVGRKKVVYIANGIIAVMAVALAFCRTMEHVMFVGILFGLGYGAYISVDWALGTDVLPSKTSAAKDMAVWHIAMVLPQSLTQPIAGFLLAGFERGREMNPVTQELTVHYSTTGYTLLFVVAAVYFALGAVLLRNVKGVR